MPIVNWGKSATEYCKLFIFFQSSSILFLFFDSLYKTNLVPVTETTSDSVASEIASAASLAVYLHGAAGDRLAETYSEYGVLASQLPAKMAEEMARLERLRDGESK